MSSVCDDYDFSLCECNSKYFWIFHCHSYLGDISDQICGKPIYIESPGMTDGKTSIECIIDGKTFFDATKGFEGKGLVPICDSKILKRFSDFSQEEFKQDINPFCKILLSVPVSHIKKTVSSSKALSSALETKPVWASSFFKLGVVLGISMYDFGLTGSWALGCNRQSSDIDLVVSLSPHMADQFLAKLKYLQKHFDGLCPDKFGFVWPLRLRSFGFDWCFFVKYKIATESPILGLSLKLLRSGVCIKAKVTNALHSCFCPSVLEVSLDSTNKSLVVFPSTEARGVFEPGDEIECIADEFLILEGNKHLNKNSQIFTVADGLVNCPSILRKIDRPDIH